MWVVVVREVPFRSAVSLLSLALFYFGDGCLPLVTDDRLFDRDRVSTSNRRRCPCFVVGFRLPLGLCLCCLFLGEVVWWRWW